MAAEKNQPVDEINSDVGSLLEAESSVGSFQSGISDVADLNDFLPQVQNEDDLRRNFYGICIRTKIYFPRDHPCQKFQISELFNKVKL